MSSTIDPSLPPLKPHYSPAKPELSTESPKIQSLIRTLNLTPHIEGGYFVETDRDARRVPNPFLANHGADKRESTEGKNKTTFYTSTGSVSAELGDKSTAGSIKGSDAVEAGAKTEKEAEKEAETTETTETIAEKEANSTRSASTTIHYLLTPCSPLGALHRNRGRTVHTLHWGRGRYVIVHADEVMAGYDDHGSSSSSGDSGGAESEKSGKARVETFVVGRDVEAGERVQWIVDGGKYKASFLLADGEGEGEGEGESGGLLISETVVPGFEYGDHDFMKADRFEALLKKEQAEEMRWMLRKDDGTA